jgi:hypothetical protein
MARPNARLAKLGAAITPIGDAVRIDLTEDWQGTIEDFALLEQVPDVDQIVLRGVFFENEHLAKLADLRLPALKNRSTRSSLMRDSSTLDSFRI